MGIITNFLHHWLVWLLVFFGILTMFRVFFTVNQQEAKIVQRFGRFVRVATTGLNVKTPWIDQVAGTLSLKVQQLQVPVQTKTKDNVIITLHIAIQFLVEKVEDAFYKLSNPHEQITSYVRTEVLSKAPTMPLDEVYEQKQQIAEVIKEQLSGVMQGYGYRIVDALVADIQPDEKVTKAMNDINAAQREQVAALARGEANKTIIVKGAEAEAESKKLQGEGIANERLAIARGLREAVELLKEGVPGASAADAMGVLILTQYFDMLQKVGANAHTNTLLLNHSPGTVHDLMEQIREVALSTTRVPSPGAKEVKEGETKTAPSAA